MATLGEVKIRILAQIGDQSLVELGMLTVPVELTGYGKVHADIQASLQSVSERLDALNGKGDDDA